MQLISNGKVKVLSFRQIGAIVAKIGLLWPKIYIFAGSMT